MSLRTKKYLKSICFGIFAFSLFLLASPESAQAGDTCFCHFEGNGDSHTICTSGGAADTHRDIHGDQPFGCECGDGFCSAGIGETCSTCPQDCGVCDGCGDNIIVSSEECDGSSDACAGITGCSADGSTCECDGCRCAPNCIVDGLCGVSEDCSNCSEDCGACSGPVCGDGVLDTGEACDDGNAVDGDCCNNQCQVTSSSCVDETTDACIGDACNDDEEGTLADVPDSPTPTPPPSKTPTPMGVAAGRNCYLVRGDVSAPGPEDLSLFFLASLVLGSARLVIRKAS